VPVTLRLEGADELERALLNSPAVLRSTQQQAMTQSLLLIEADARRNVRQDTRRLMNSITHRQRATPRGLIGEAGPSAGYGIHVERGTRPHWPPRAPLEGWSRRHGIPVFLVQRAIARKGTRARPFLLPAFRKNAEAIVRLFAAAGARAVATLGTSGTPSGGGR
jgi:hypothetical protein